jgi:hypothetical protein
VAREEVSSQARIKGEEIQAKSRIDAEKIQRSGNIEAALIRNRGDDKREERELNKRIDAQTKNARAEYNAYRSNKDRVAEIRDLKGKLNLKPDNKFRKDAENRLAEIKREEQRYIRDLAKSYELAKIDDILAEANAGDSTASGDIKFNDPKAAQYYEQYK